LVKQRDQLAPRLYQRAVTQLEAECDALLDRQVETPEAQKLVRRYRKHQAALFVFLHHAEVPFHNNAAERALRNSVIHRKVTGGFRSETGAKAHAVVSSVVDTARKRGQDILQVIQELVGTPTPTQPVHTLAG